MFVVANLLGSTVQISTLPLPVLSTLQAAGLVFNSICATLILSEPFTRWSLCGTLLVTSGAVLIAIFGAIPSPAHDLNGLLILLRRRPFIAWMALQALFVVGLGTLYYLHRGLKLVSTSVLYPLVFCVYNIIAILDGLIYFDQVSLIPPLHAGLIALGTVILLSGVFALSWRLSDEQHAPGVGQSTLAPGLGLLDDTEGEEESLLSSEVAVEEGSSSSGYQTFTIANGDTTVLIPTPKKEFRWAERAEIWGELEDQEEPITPTGRLRSATLPGQSESSPLLPPRRSASGNFTASGEAGLSNEPVFHRPGRRRRRSTGFPGLVARRNIRQRQSSISGSLSGWLQSIPWLRRREMRRSMSSSFTADDVSRQHHDDDEHDAPSQRGRAGNDSAV
ncbi:hypothetical protein E5D57_001976 [Metarhizium anisopliae]|nr:hypothetical protein E5D57_001976 [Metarhizium anisopliae]